MHKPLLSGKRKEEESSFFDHLVYNSLNDSHYVIRNEKNDILLWLWVKQKLYNVPEDWNDVGLAVRHPHGDFESVSLTVLEMSLDRIRLEGQVVSPLSNESWRISLEMKRSFTKNVLYVGTLSREGFIPAVVRLLIKDCSPNVWITPFPYNDPTIVVGSKIYYDEKWWNFEQWNTGSAHGTCTLTRNHDIGTIKQHAAVIDCRKLENRSITQDVTMASSSRAFQPVSLMIRWRTSKEHSWTISGGILHEGNEIDPNFTRAVQQKIEKWARARFFFEDPFASVGMLVAYAVQRRSTIEMAKPNWRERTRDENVAYCAASLLIHCYDGANTFEETPATVEVDIVEILPSPDSVDKPKMSRPLDENELNNQQSLRY